MPLQVMLAASLRKHAPGYDHETGCMIDIAPGKTIREVAQLLSIPIDEIKLIMLEGRSAKLDDVLKGDERLAFFPPIGGG